MTGTMPAAVKAAMDEAEGGLISLKEDFDLIEKQASLNDHVSYTSYSPWKANQSYPHVC